MEATHSNTVSDLFRSHFWRYQSERKLRIEEHRAAQAIIRCRTEDVGSYQVACENGHIERQGFHSCHHRSCPKCNGSAQRSWLDKTADRLMGVDHFHVIFTLPHELIELWLHNRIWCSSQLSSTAAESLKTMLRDPRHLGAEPAMLFTQHTWGRNLAFHPHLHGLVAAGGLTASGQWIDSRNGYLLPGRALASLFRGKWLAALNQALADGELQHPAGQTEADIRRMLRQIARKRWHVRIQGRYGHGKGVATYLSRYVRGGAIQDHRLLRGAGDKVRFAYLDHRDQKQKVQTLSRDAFMGRVLSHVPPARRHVVRYYGLYHPRATQRLRTAKLSQGECPNDAPTPTRSDRVSCATCGGPMMTLHWRRNRNSLIGSSARRYVQLEVQANTPTRRFGESPPNTSPPLSFFERGRVA